MVHLNCFFTPHCVHQNINRTFLVIFNLTIQNWHSEDDALLPCAENSLFTSILGLAVEVGRVSRGVGFVRGSFRLAIENIVGRDVDEQDIAAVALRGKFAGGFYIQTLDAFGVGRAFVGKAFSSTVDNRSWPSYSGVSAFSSTMPGLRTYLTSSNRVTTSSEFPKSTFLVIGGFARENPVLFRTSNSLGCGEGLIPVRTCSDNIPTIFLKSLDGLTTELASGTSDNDDFLGRSHILLADLNCSG